jgi:hypothetical protein
VPGEPERRASRWTALVLPALASPAAAHVRLHNPANGASLYWSNPAAVDVVLSALGSDDIHDQSHLAALRAALASWNALEGSLAELVEDDDPAQMARTDWESDSIHLVMWDDDDASGYFPPGTGIVALTPVWFSASGKITDADVLFNGDGFEFTTSGELGAFDVQDVAAHELGHVLGLDHTGCVGGTLYPYVDPLVILHRSPSSDEAAGLAAAYPAIGAGGAPCAVEGRVERADGSGLPGAFVVARDAAGRTAASILAAADGSYRLDGLALGSYSIYARPLDEPVSKANLTGGWIVATDFAPAFLAGAVVVGGGETADVAPIVAEPDAALHLGKAYDEFPLRATSGASAQFVLHGSGLMSGSTLAASDPAVGVAVKAWLGSEVRFALDVPAAASPGHFDLEVLTPFGDRDVLPGAVEVVPPEPIVTGVTPPLGSSHGGTALQVFGSGFRPGAMVAIGGGLYRDGEPGGCSVIDASTIELVIAPTPQGVYDVVVLDPTGVEGRVETAYLAADLPVIHSVFPSAGSASGGTVVVVLGAHFQPGTAVLIDGVAQTLLPPETAGAAAASADGERLCVLTSGGLPGVSSLEVLNPGGGVASAAFAYVPSPDPWLGAVAPAYGAHSGGESIVVSGAHFEPGMALYFGADPDDGTGGIPAAQVTYVDEHTLDVVTPTHAAGDVSLMVCSATGQAHVLAASFTFEKNGGGAGGCSVVAAAGPRGARPGVHGARPGRVLADLAPLFVLLGAAAARGALARARLGRSLGPA